MTYEESYKFNKDVLRNEEFGFLIVDQDGRKIVIAKDTIGDGDVEILDEDDVHNAKNCGYSTSTNLVLGNLQEFLGVPYINGEDRRMEFITFHKDLEPSLITYERAPSFFIEQNTGFVVHVKYEGTDKDRYIAICIDNNIDGNLMNIGCCIDGDLEKIREYGMSVGELSNKMMWELLNPISIDGNKERPMKPKYKLTKITIDSDLHQPDDSVILLNYVHPIVNGFQPIDINKEYSLPTHSLPLLNFLFE
jgi:hypothetical protein